MCDSRISWKRTMAGMQEIHEWDGAVSRCVELTESLSRCLFCVFILMQRQYPKDLSLKLILDPSFSPLCWKQKLKLQIIWKHKHHYMYFPVVRPYSQFPVYNKISFGFIAYHDHCLPIYWSKHIHKLSQLIKTRWCFDRCVKAKGNKFKPCYA